MPITRSAKKALRSAGRKKVVNDRRSRAMKEAVKDVRALVVAKSKTEAQTKLAQAFQSIDKAAKQGVIKKNAAARKKSRLAKNIAKIA